MELGTGNWNNRGIDNHVKRPAGCSSAGLKRMGMKRIDGETNAKGNTSRDMEQSLKYPRQCLVDNEHVYDADAVQHVPSNIRTDYSNHSPAGIEAAKTVQYNNYAALSCGDRDGPQGGKVPSWLVGAQTKRRCDDPSGNNGDPVKHEHVLPHRLPTRPIRRMGPHGNDGPMYDNGAAGLNWNLTQQNMNTGPLHHDDMDKEQWRVIGAREHISPLGEVLYNVGGREDMRPACSKEYTKADRPATLMTQYDNDSRQLALFERFNSRRKPGHTRQQCPQLKESKEMVKALYGGESSAGNSVIGGSSAYQQDDYAPSGSGYSDAASDLRPRSAPQQARSTGTMSARGSRTSPSVRSFDESSRRSGGYGDRTPQSSRGSMRSYDDRGSYRGNNDRGSYRGDDERSIASTYYTESQGSRSMRSKSVDGFSGNQRRYKDTGSSRSGMSGMFSDPSRTVTEQALNQALKSRGVAQKTPRKNR